MMRLTTLFVIMLLGIIAAKAQMGISQEVWKKLHDDFHSNIEQEIPDYQGNLSFSWGFHLGSEGRDEMPGHLYLQGGGNTSHFRIINYTYYVDEIPNSLKNDKQTFDAKDFDIHFNNLHWHGALITISSQKLGVSRTIPINVTLPWNRRESGLDLGYIYYPQNITPQNAQEVFAHDWKLEVVTTGYVTMSSVPISQIKALTKKVRAEYEAQKNTNNSSSSISSPNASKKPAKTGHYDQAAVAEAKYVASLSPEEQDAWYERKYQEALENSKSDFQREQEYNQRQYKQQQQDKLKYATNPGAYYLEKSGAWNNYNSMLDQIEQNDRRKQDQLDQQWRNQQRQERLARIRQEQEDAKQDALGRQRTDYFYSLPQKELPYNGINTSSNKLYYFFYHYTGSLRNAENIHVSNVFAIGQYPDGSWPDSQKITEAIYRASIDPRKYVNVSHDIVGYFSSETAANQALTEFKNHLYSLKLNSKTLNYQGDNTQVIAGGNEAMKPVNQLFAQAGDLFGQQKYQEALDLYQKGLKQNGGNFNNGLFMNSDMEAIGYIYYIQKNYGESKKWFENAANNGSVYASRNLAQMYFNGIGGQPDQDEAMFYLSKAAEKGDPLSERELALFYFDNNQPIQAEQALVRVANNLEQPIEERNRAMLLLAKAFAYGQNGFLKIPGKSYDWFAKLLNFGQIRAGSPSGNLEGDFEYAMVSLDVPMASTDLASLLNIVIENPEQPEHRRNASRLALANAILFKNERMRKPMDLAIEHYLFLKEKDYDVDDFLGLCYLEKDRTKEAFQLHQPWIYAAFYHYDGKETIQDHNKAVALWKEQSLDEPVANMLLAVAHFAGKGVDKDVEMAKQLFLDDYENLYGTKNVQNYFQTHFEAFFPHFPEFQKDYKAFNAFLRNEDSDILEQNDTSEQVSTGQNIYDQVWKATKKSFSSEAEGYYMAKKGNKVGLLDSIYNIVIPIAYESIELIGPKANAIIKKSGKYGIMDQNGVETVPIKFDELRVNEYNNKTPIVAKLNGKYGHIDKNGNTKIPFLYEYSDFFYNGLSEVRLQGKVGYINMDNEMVIQNQFEDGSAFIGNEGVCAAKKNGKWGYIDRNGKTVIPFRFVEAGYFSSGKARVKDARGEEFYIDMNGKKLK